MVVGDTWTSIEKLETLLIQAAIHQDPTVRGGKFLAKRHKQDDRITHIVVGISRYSRWLLDCRELVGEAEYRQAVQEFENLFLSTEILSPPVVVTLEEWRRYDEDRLLSG